MKNPSLISPVASFGSRLAETRQRRGFTQKDLATALNADPRLIRYYERKADAPKVDFVQKCAHALGVSMDELIGSGSQRRPSRPGPESSTDRIWRRVAAMRPRRRTSLLRLIELLLPEFERKGRK